MALRNTFRSITERDLFPDRIDIIFYISFPPCSAMELNDAIRGIGGTLAGYNIRLVERLICIGYSLTFNIKRSMFNAFLQISVTVNPLQYLHLRRPESEYYAERPYAKNNWAHSSDMAPDECLIYGAADDIYNIARITAEEIAIELSEYVISAPSNYQLVTHAQHIRAAFSDTVGILEARIQSVEMAVDLFSPTPNFLIEFYAEKFVREFANVRRRTYGRAGLLESIDENGRMVEASGTYGTRYKAYIKTAKRVRIEVRANGIFFRRHGIAATFRTADQLVQIVSQGVV